MQYAVYTGVMNTIVVWLRNDLRIRDNPALYAAVQKADCVIPLFIIDEKLVHGSNASMNRNLFLKECLEDLRSSLQGLGGDLVVRHGEPLAVLNRFVSDYGVNAVYYTADYSPYSLKRDAEISRSLADDSVEVHVFNGRLIIDSPLDIMTKAKSPYKVFSPFWRTWQVSSRRMCVEVPDAIKLPDGLIAGSIDDLEQDIHGQVRSSDVIEGGENAARKRFFAFLENNIAQYHTSNNDMAADTTSRLSAYLHFGCISPREIETLLPDSDGAAAWYRQLCWRDFYYYILYHFPGTIVDEFQDRYKNSIWTEEKTLIQAWKNGKTGYPIVDAAMRQLRNEGWMHNRARLIVGSFLTKDLLQDWRVGERYFMNILIDGDRAVNMGNWQWIASVGVDPAPVFRRLYNPTSQQRNYDSSGNYVRRYVPELMNVSDEHLAEPWLMSIEEQVAAGCRIGVDYPAPIVNHAEARKIALDWYRQS
jgi:deoxyribodipyrimidine photo-lyase